MKADLAMVRRFYAEEIQAVCNVRSTLLVEALATVHRDDFLPPGPWSRFNRLLAARGHLLLLHDVTSC